MNTSIMKSFFSFWDTLRQDLLSSINIPTHLMASERFLTASVMYVGSVSVDINVKAPSDLLLLRLLIFGACG